MDISDRTTYTVDDVIAVIEWCVAEYLGTYNMGEVLRTVVWQCPRSLTSAHWVEACAEFGVSVGTARNRRSEALRNLEMVA